MFSFDNGCFVFKFGGTKVAFAVGDAQSNLRSNPVGMDVALSESSSIGGIRSDVLLAYMPGEYGLNNVSIKVASFGGYNFNQLRFNGGLNLFEFSSELLLHSDNHDSYIKEMTGTIDSLVSDESIILIDSLYDIDANAVDLVKESALMIKNTENKKFIILASSNFGVSLNEEFGKIGIEPVLISNDDIKLSKLADVKAISDLTIIF
jgi:hypothetical protein